MGAAVVPPCRDCCQEEANRGDNALGVVDPIPILPPAGNGRRNRAWAPEEDERKAERSGPSNPTGLTRLPTDEGMYFDAATELAKVEAHREPAVRPPSQIARPLSPAPHIQNAADSDDSETAHTPRIGQPDIDGSDWSRVSTCSSNMAEVEQRALSFSDAALTICAEQVMPEQPALPSLYVVSIEKPHSSGYGIYLDSLDSKCLLVGSITKGPIMEWNEEHADARIDLHDHITQVNGNDGDSFSLRDKLIEVARTKSSLELTLRRHPPEFAVTLQRERGQPLGLTFQHMNCCSNLLITSINEGPLADWNKGQAETGGPQVKPMDRIVVANGKRGDADTLCGPLSCDLTIELKIIPSICDGPSHS